MSKPLLVGPGGSFVTLSAQPRGRLGVVRLGRLIAGPAFSNPGHLFKFSNESDLGRFMAQRIDVTVAKFQYAMAQCFAMGETNPLLIVEGARAQHGQGHSSVRSEGGKTYLSGTEAAHFGIGTITMRGDALSIKAARDLVRLANESGVRRRDIASTFEASGQLAAYGMAQDGVTYYAPAMINRVEGMLEVIKQRYLLGVLPAWIPKDPTQLEQSMNVMAVRIAELMIGRRAAISPILQRLDELRHSPSAREFLQDPNDPDPGNKLYKGTESTFLDAQQSALTDSSSSLHGEVDSVVRHATERSSELVEKAVEARAEQSDAE